MTIVVLCLFCLVILRSLLEASDQNRTENYWFALDKEKAKVEAEVTADGGIDHCMAFEPDLMRKLATVHLQKGETAESAKIYSKLWIADRKITGPDYNRQFVDDAIGLANVYQAQGSHMHAVTCYTAVLDYDKTSILQNDSSVLARDYNNLGVAYYLAANTKQHSGERKKLYESSDAMYRNALDIADHKKAPFLVSTINHNRTLTLRDR